MPNTVQEGKQIHAGDILARGVEAATHEEIHTFLREKT
jgi:hypothetical protein